MISLSCRSCGEKNQCESFLAASQQNCMHCGRPLMGDSLVQSAPSRSGPKPWEQIENAPSQVTAGTRNIAIKIIAYFNFFYAALYLACGLLLWITSSMVPTSARLNAPPPSRPMPPGRTVMPPPPQTQQNVNVKPEELQMVLNILAAIFVIVGLPMAAAGAGLLMRAPWGRYLALVLGSLAAILTVVNVGFAIAHHARPDLCSLVMNISYAGVTFFVLFQADVIAEFHPPAPSST